jgi:hypothetical protein
MDVLNYAKIASEEIYAPSWVNASEYAPRWPFRMLIAGMSGSGKTNLLTSMILDNFISYTKIYIFARNSDQILYEYIVKKVHEIQKIIEDDPVLADMYTDINGSTDLIEVVNTYEEIPKVAEISDKISKKKLKEYKEKYGFVYQPLVVFDDFMDEPKQKSIESYFIYGRHHGISCVYIAQTYFKTPSVIRRNCNVFALFRIAGLEFDVIARDNGDIEKEKLKEFYKESRKKPHQFILMDFSTGDQDWMLRINFNTIKKDGEYVDIRSSEKTFEKSQAKNDNKTDRKNEEYNQKMLDLIKKIKSSSK